jgi:hypothetical protein
MFITTDCELVAREIDPEGLNRHFAPIGSPLEGHESVTVLGNEEPSGLGATVNW